MESSHRTIRKFLSASYLATDCAKFPKDNCTICDARQNSQACEFLRNDKKLQGCMNSGGVPIYWTKRISRPAQQTVQQLHTGTKEGQRPDVAQSNTN